MPSLSDPLTTPGGVVVPGSVYDLTPANRSIAVKWRSAQRPTLVLAHNGHVHTVSTAAIATFLDDTGGIRYEARTTGLVVGFLAPHVTGATLKL